MFSLFKWNKRQLFSGACSSPVKSVAKTAVADPAEALSCVALSSSQCEHPFVVVCLINVVSNASLKGQCNNQIEKMPRTQKVCSEWKSVLNESSSLLYFLFSFFVKCKTAVQVNALLPTETFIPVIRGLLENPLPSVRRKALDLLNNKLQQKTSWKKKIVSEDCYRPISHSWLYQSCI